MSKFKLMMSWLKCEQSHYSFSSLFFSAVPVMLICQIQSLFVITFPSQGDNCQTTPTTINRSSSLQTTTAHSLHLYLVYCHKTRCRRGSDSNVISRHIGCRRPVVRLLWHLHHLKRPCSPLDIFSWAFHALCTYEAEYSVVSPRPQPVGQHSPPVSFASYAKSSGRLWFAGAPPSHSGGNLLRELAGGAGFPER